MAGAPHPEDGLPGQPAGERDGGDRASGSTSTPSTSTRPSSGRGYTEAAATELRCDRDAIKAELGQVLLAIEDAQAAAITPPPTDAVAAMSAAEREDALSLLTAPDLMDQVAGAFTTLGVVGEQTSALTAWLTLTSRLSDRPLGAVIQSSSSAGKSTLADAALALMPTEATVAYSAMTGQALYYLGETDLAHKVLSIAEEEGAARASYALKLLVSEGRLSIAAAGKDPLTGRLVTNTYEVTGPVALLMTTTSAELDEELANRLLVLAVDEGRHQTRAVHVAQRDAETLEGLVARARRADVIARHANAQRLLSPVAVVNPHAPTLGFSDRSTRNRRDNAKYLGLIRAVTLAHQHQRSRETGRQSRARRSPTSRPPTPTWPWPSGSAVMCSTPPPTSCHRPPAISSLPSPISPPPTGAASPEGRCVTPPGSATAS